MKKFILFILIIGIVGGGYFLHQQNEEKKLKQIQREKLFRSAEVTKSITDGSFDTAQELIYKYRSDNPAEYTRLQQLLDLSILSDYLQNGVKINEINFKRDGNYIYSTGSISNIGNKDINYYEIVVDFVNANDKVIDSDYTNGSIRLKPGDTRQFELMTRFTSGTSGGRCRIEKIKF